MINFRGAALPPKQARADGALRLLLSSQASVPVVVRGDARLRQVEGQDIAAWRSLFRPLSRLTGWLTVASAEMMAFIAG